VSRSSYGRALRGLRDNEDGARAFGVPATRRKLEAFAFAGFLAGCGGAIYAHGLPRLTASSFAATESITVVAVALIGGLALMIGPLLGALYLLALPALVTLDAVGLAVSTFGWLVLLLYFPGGLAQAVKPLRERAFGWLAADVAAEDVGQAQDVVAEIRAATSSLLPARPVASSAPASSEALLDVTGLSKSFGGVDAVRDVSLQVRSGETVGIIGPNGAGKTTLFELIGGFTPVDAGIVRFAGRDVTSFPPERRARLGLVRSFQDARLFPTLTVRETLEIAAERQQPSRLWSSLVAWPTSLARDDERRARADDLLGLMGLARYADSAVNELSTGTRRITDLASLLVLQPRLVLLDEPSSGVAQRETEALGGLLAQLRVALDTTFVIIEHDMPLLLGISDRVVAMETGEVIAEGRPGDVVNHPQVVASYLGQDRTAVERSGAVDPSRATVRNQPRPSTAGSTA
jgi:ABC-type branched-subunit amino acid transport system ATPase component